MQIVKGGNVTKLIEKVKIPRMFHATQQFHRQVIKPEDIPAEIFRELSKPGIADTIKPGMRIAITAGSRGVANVSVITKAIVDFCREKGADPFVVAAMGSHGGASSDGQREILAGFGITEEAMGCEIKSDMDTVLLGYSERNKPVYQDKNAYEADGIILSCRIKPHNAFRGPIESGICKMLVVGLGKQPGAESIHSDGMGNIQHNIPANAKTALEKSKILFAIPCLENAYDETAMFEAVPAKDIMEREKELLLVAKGNMPSLLVNECDVLIVNAMGKKYSGTGVDPNISGTWSTQYASGGVRVKRTGILDLEDDSHGNGNGVGLADIISARLFNKLDSEMIYPNCFTSTVLKSGMIPPAVATDKEVFQACIQLLNGMTETEKENCRIIRIKNTLHIDRIMLSEAYYEDVVKGRYKGLTADSEPEYLEFDEEEALVTEIP